MVFEVGAGAGALTRELAATARRVIAVEFDPALAGRLRRRFARQANVEVIEGDALSVPLPGDAFRAFGNIPFQLTTALLRRLLDEAGSPMSRADLVVQLHVARKRTRTPARSPLTLSWAPWWRFEMGPRLPAHLFHPRPGPDAAVLTIVRRDPPLLAASERAEYGRLLRRAFHRAGEPMPAALRANGPPKAMRAAIGRAGISSRARPVDLTAEEWAAVFVALRRGASIGYPPR